MANQDETQNGNVTEGVASATATNNKVVTKRKSKKVAEAKSAKPSKRHARKRLPSSEGFANPQSVMGYVDAFTEVPIQGKANNAVAINRLSELLEDMSLVQG